MKPCFTALCAVLTLLVLPLLVLPLPAAVAHDGASGVVKERMDLYKRNQTNLKAIRRHMQQGAWDAVPPLANQIADWADRMKDYFPEGSGASPSEASPRIWEDWDGFLKAAEANGRAARAMTAAAAAGDAAGLEQAFIATANSCKGCHQSYRR